MFCFLKFILKSFGDSFFIKKYVYIFLLVRWHDQIWNFQKKNHTVAQKVTSLWVIVVISNSIKKIWQSESEQNTRELRKENARNIKEEGTTGLGNWKLWGREGRCWGWWVTLRVWGWKRLVDFSWSCPGYPRQKRGRGQGWSAQIWESYIVMILPGKKL